MRQQFAPAAPGVDAMAAAKEGTLRLLHVDSATHKMWTYEDSLFTRFPTFRVAGVVKPSVSSS